MHRVRILIVDDSPIFVEALRIALEEDPALQVVGVASDGRAALAAAIRLRPDLITMDVMMPEMDGLEAVEQIMAEVPTPILVLTAEPHAQDLRGSFDALSRGALDLLPKPALLDTDGAARRKLREHIKLLATVPVIHHFNRNRRRVAPVGQVAEGVLRDPGAVGIVASTGGPSVLAAILAGLPRDFPLGVAIVQHIAPGFASSLVSWLAHASPLEVRVATEGETLRPGMVRVAPDGGHLVFDAHGKLHLDTGHGPDNGHRPSGDRLLHSLASVWGSRGVGVVLTGMGSDGADGLAAVHRAGGVTLAQDAATSTVDGMPGASRALGIVQHVIPREGFPAALMQVAARLVERR